MNRDPTIKTVCPPVRFLKQCHQSNSDHTLFLKKQQGKITALIVYVNDMVVTGNDPEERKALQKYLSKEFKMKDLVLRNIFLELKCLDLIEVSFYHKEILKA